MHAVRHRHPEMSDADLPCRICLSVEATEEDGRPSAILRPCRCSGTQANIHAVCLSKWLSTCARYDCELCQFPYQIHITYTPIWTLLMQKRFPEHWHRLLLHCIYLLFLVRRVMDMIRTWARPLKSFFRRVIWSLLIAHTSLFIMADCRYIYNELRIWSRQGPRITIVDEPFGRCQSVLLP
jgi:E3 ubiquitin-protein ligase DOA10